jgi:hypothetical protein
VKHLVLASFASALVGGMSGTGLMLWMTRDEPASLPSTPVVSAESSAELAKRLTALERTLAAVERQGQVGPTALATDDAPPADGSPVLDDPPVAVGSPVFEAAVLDIIDRAEEDRELQRSATRDARKQRRSEHWANEVTMRLGLTPAQTETLRAIEAELDSRLERERRASTEGPFVPRDQRRAARQAIRQHAERRLRGTLAPPQQAAYDELDDKLKLYRPQTGD